MKIEKLAELEGPTELVGIIEGRSVLLEGVWKFDVFARDKEEQIMDW